MNRVAKKIVEGISWVLFATGGMSFWAGGRALHEFAGINRAVAEIEGLAAAVALLLLGMGLRAAAGLPMFPRSRGGDKGLA